MGIAAQPADTALAAGEIETLDALIIGGGVSGIYQLQGLRQLAACGQLHRLVMHKAWPG